MMFHWSVVFLIISYHQVTPFFIPVSFSDLKAIAEFAYDTYGKFQEVYGIYESQTATEEVSLDDVLKEVRKVASKVEEMGAKIERHIDQAVQTLLQRLPLEGNINLKKNELHNAIVRIDDLFDSFVIYSEDKENFNNITIERFINTITSDNSNDLKDSLNKMHRLFIIERTGSVADSLFSLVNKHTKMVANEICDTGSPPQLQLYQLYTMIMKTQIRGFLMISFANLMLEVFHKISFQGGLKKAERKIIKRAKELMAAVKAEMKNAPRDMRRCDPPVHKRDETFLDFVGFMRGFVANEKKLNEKDSCGWSCSTQPVKPARLHYFGPRQEKYKPGYGSCEGKMLDCSYGGKAKWEICAHSEGPRLYSYIVNGYGSKFGKKEKCTGRIKEPIATWDASWYHCDFCMCTCVADDIISWARRKISLRPQIADIKNNKVMTGVRFVDKHGLIHMQIREGVLEPDGRIERDTEIWKELEVFHYLKNMTASAKQVYIVKDRHALIGHPGRAYDRMGEGRDFALLREDQRRIHLDDILAPINHVVTGIRFQHPKIPTRQESQPIEIAIHVTPFNYSSGTLMPTSEDIWVTPESKGSRTKIDLNEKKNPIESAVNLPDSKTNSYVEVTASDWWYDAAQSTIPFLDSQPVHGVPSFPLGGVGLFHKGAEGFGGFLALKIFCLDLPEYMSEKVPDELILS